MGRVMAPEISETPPASYLMMCPRWSHTTEYGGVVRCVRSATWLPMVPEMTSRAASWPVSEAIWASSSLVVGSSRKTSSMRVVFLIASSMDSFGVVMVSERKSYADGPGVDQALNSL